MWSLLRVAALCVRCVAEKKKKTEADEKKKAAAEEKKAAAILTPWEQGLKDIRDGVFWQAQGTINKDRRSLIRASRQLTVIRQRLRPNSVYSIRLLRRTCGELCPEAIQGTAFAAVESKLIVTEKDEEEEKKDKEREEKQKEAYAAAVASGALRPKSPLVPPSGDAATTAASTATTTPATSPPAPTSTATSAAAIGAAGSTTPAVPAAPAPVIVAPYVPDPAHIALPEVKVYLQFVVAQFVHDNGLDAESITAITSLVNYIQSLNRRTIDLLSARVYSLWSLAYEKVGRLADIREALHVAHQTATIQHNEPGMVNHLFP
jgi:hypothetical protein